MSDTTTANPTDTGWVADTPAAIDFVVWTHCLHGLALKINTRMELTRHRTALAAAQSHGFTTKRTAKGALKEMVAHRKTLEPDWTPSKSVQRALDA